MISSAAIFVIILILAGFLRRALSHRRSAKEDKYFENYLRRHEQESELQLLSMRKEAARFDSDEALAPVEAGLNEILELHGGAVDLALRREDDALILEQTNPEQFGPIWLAPNSRIEVTWVRRTATLMHKGKSRNIFGNGHWELKIGDDIQEPFMELAPLMGRLSALIRKRSEIARYPESLPGNHNFPISTSGG